MQWVGANNTPGYDGLVQARDAHVRLPGVGGGARDEQEMTSSERCHSRYVLQVLRATCYGLLLKNKMSPV